MNISKKDIWLVCVSVILAILGSTYVQGKLTKETVQEREHRLIKEYYDTENKVSVSPHGMRLKMDAGEFTAVLVDLRSQEEYEEGHITGAINIPAYKDKNTPDYGAVERIVGEFKKIPKEKEIIVYCYSVACMTSRKIGAMLADQDIFVKHLNIGWNEWRNDWQSFNHQHEWYSTWSYQYITTGKEPGEIKVRKENVENATCPANGFGC
jgi:rhodanese-related sulfurtransferase